MSRHFSTLNLRNDTRYSHSYYRTSICALSDGDIANDLDGPLTRFQGHGIFEGEYLKKMLLWTMLLEDSI